MEGREIYRAAQLPVFQNRVFHSREAGRDCAKGDMELVQSVATGLIFNRAFDPSLMVYDADYQNEQAVSGVFQAHLACVAAAVDKHFRGCSLIEVGCGKGHFLEQLQGLGYTITGLDPSYEGTNPAVIKKYFTADIGLNADGIILRHVLEHIHDPVTFLSMIRDANGGGGNIYIEVPCLEWIRSHGAWFDIFYEHVNYFRLADFHRMFGVVHEAGHTFNGQYLSIVADLATIRRPVADRGDIFELPGSFTATVRRHADRLRNRPAGAAPAAVWGGASKGVIFSLFMLRAGAPIDMVIDINPAKQGKFLAASGLQIWSPKAALERLTPGAEIFVMNANYLEEIRTLTNDRFQYLAIENETV